jgi:hypothetical protein
MTKIDHHHHLEILRRLSDRDEILGVGYSGEVTDRQTTDSLTRDKLNGDELHRSCNFLSNAEHI